jgi:hypothetical protein
MFVLLLEIEILLVLSQSEVENIISRAIATEA